jgi:hypothetical protein
VLVESVRRFKGLEKPVIVLVEFEGLLDHQDLLYVAASPARSIEGRGSGHPQAAVAGGVHGHSVGVQRLRMRAREGS